MSTKSVYSILSSLLSMMFRYIVIFFSLLVNVLQVLKKYTAGCFIDKVINRISRLDGLNRYNHLIDDFNMDFVVCLNCPSIM